MTRRVSFAGYVLDSDTRELIRAADETRVHVSPKALELLSFLIAERPRVVGKDELHKRLWPETFVSDVTLASVVSDLREALDDHERPGRIIRTAHGFGYSFAADASSGETSIAAALCWLVVDGREFALREGIHVIGRDSDVTVPLPAPGVSRRHAQLTVSATGVVLADLGSKNGTSLRGLLIEEPVPLSDGDEIHIDAFRLIFHTGGFKGSTETVR